MVVAFLTVVAVLAPGVAPYDPLAMGTQALSPPSARHLMGTDHLGRDVLSGVLWGLRISLIVGIGSALISVVVGILIGSPAGYFRGRLDNALMRATDAFMVLPTFFLILLVVSVFGASIWRLIALIGITNWPPIARLVRAEFLSLREREFILAARTVGVGHFTIMVSGVRNVVSRTSSTLMPSMPT